MKGYSYHGYSITNHYKVDPRYGTLDEYKELASKAKQKGLKLIFDDVLNHIGSNYWWMNDLPFKNWINYPDSFVGSGHRRTTNQDLYASQYDKDLMTKGWFDKTMPDMNGTNPFMANYLTQCSMWWIETLQLGGIREDTYGYSDKNFLKQWSCAIMNEYPNFNMVGEEWSLNPLITSYWQQGKVNKDGFSDCLETVMDFPMQDALVQSLNGNQSASYNAPFTKLYEALANDFVYADPKNILVFGDNHDMDRLFMQLNQDVDLTKMAVTYILTIRGIPEMFYGTEVLMDNTGHHKVDGLIRSDFPGGWKEDTVNAFTGKGLTAKQSSMQSYMKQLLNWRKTSDAVHNGNTLHFAPFNGLYVYFRYTKKEMIMVVMNKNNGSVNVDTKRLAEILNGRSYAKNVLTSETFNLSNGLTVAGKSATVFEIR
jgi:glycosidase